MICVQMRLEIRECRKFCRISVVNLCSLFTSCHVPGISNGRPLVDKNSRLVIDANRKGAKNEPLCNRLYILRPTFVDEVAIVSAYLLFKCTIINKFFTVYARIFKLIREYF